MDKDNLLKEWKSYEEQADILIKRGIVTENRKEIVDFLSCYNYYYVTGYLFNHLIEDSKYIDEYNRPMRFDNVKDIIYLDSVFRMMMLFCVDLIEKNLKSKVSYYCGEFYGADGYLNEKNFVSSNGYPNVYNKFRKTFKELKEKNKEKSFIKHHFKKYNGVLPIWVAVEIMPLGTLFHLFDMLNIKVKRKISKGLRISVEELESWFLCLVKFRNLFAHNNRLYRYDLPIQPKQRKGYKVNTRKLFSCLMMMRHLFENSIDRGFWNTFVIINIDTIVKTNRINMHNCYGFPENWKEILQIKI